MKMPENVREVDLNDSVELMDHQCFGLPHLRVQKTAGTVESERDEQDEIAHP